MKKLALITAIILSFLVLLISKRFLIPAAKPSFGPTPVVTQTTSPTPTIAPSPTILPSPSPKPLTFAEMNQLYGPCVKIPVLYYHHIQTEAEAKRQNQTSLSVYTPIFEGQMNYLQAHGYSVVPTEKIADYINGETVPKNPVALTFDDAYEDFYTDVYPILKRLNFPATMFVPTGLVNNPDYLTQGQIQEMAGGGLIYFANHTWSHSTMRKSATDDRNEITLAHTQLQNLGLNKKNVFAYPYGEVSQSAINILEDLNYSEAFTTKHGTALCKKLVLQLPRVRVANQPLAKFGL